MSKLFQKSKPVLNADAHGFVEAKRGSRSSSSSPEHFPDISNLSWYVCCKKLLLEVFLIFFLFINLKSTQWQTTHFSAYFCFKWRERGVQLEGWPLLRTGDPQPQLQVSDELSSWQRKGPELCEGFLQILPHKFAGYLRKLFTAALGGQNEEK